MMIVEIWYMNKAGREADPMSFMKADGAIKAIIDGKKEYFTKVDEQERMPTCPTDEALEELFTLYNGMAGGEDPEGTPNPLSDEEMQNFIKTHGVGHTSMSVGDFIKISGESGVVHVVDGVGFSKAHCTWVDRVPDDFTEW